MKPKRIRKNGQPWPNNIGRWADTLTAEQRADHFKSGPRAQWGPEKEPPKKADDGPWAWPLALDRYDRASPLTTVEEDMLTRYAEAYRFYRYGRTMDFGPSLNRLVQPLNDGLDYTGITAEAALGPIKSRNTDSASEIMPPRFSSPLPIFMRNAAVVRIPR